MFGGLNADISLNGNAKTQLCCVSDECKRVAQAIHTERPPNAFSSKA